MRPFSSNSGYRTNRTIYCICRKDSGYDFQPILRSENPCQKCNLCIPSSKTELTKISESMKNYIFDNSNLRQAINFWTDYVRKNETHFWSEIRQNWWSQCRSSDLSNPTYSNFPSTVDIDGHKKIRNVIDRNRTGCICIGKVIQKIIDIKFGETPHLDTAPSIK